MAGGRPKGAANFNPNKKRLEQGFKDKGFDYVDEFIKLYKDSGLPLNLKASLLQGLTEFLYPKRRAEDEDGKPNDQPLVVVTDELLKAMAQSARDQK